MKALILAGGLGTRLRPLTDHVPKSLLPICNVAFLEQQIALIAKYNIKDVVLLTGYLGAEFAPLAERLHSTGINLTISTETEPLGTAGAARSLLDQLDDTTVVFNGDVLTDLDIGAVLEAHKDKQAEITIVLTPVDDARPYGLVPLDQDGRVLEFREKPEEEIPGDINAGTYVLEPSVLEEVPTGKFWQFEQQLFPSLLSQGRRLFGYPSDAYWLDIGTPQRYLQAHFDVLEGRARAMVDGQVVNDSKSFDDGTAITGPVLLSHAPVGKGARIGPLVSIGPRARIGTGARIERSVIHEDAMIGERAVVVDSIIGRGASVKADAECRDSVVAAETA